MQLPKKPATWHSLFVQTDSDEGVTAALLGTLEFFGYQKYDPFPGGLGTPPGLKTFIKQFVAPTQDGWVRVLGEPDPNVLLDFSKELTVLHAWFENANSGIAVYSSGTRSDDLAPFLKSNKSPSDLARAFDGTLPVEAEPAQPAPTIVTLPVDVQELAKSANVSTADATKMIEKMSGQIMGKLDRSSGGEASAMQDQAKALLAGAAGVDWSSAPGQKLKGLVSVLNLPTNWRKPDFDSVREAYQVARRLRRSPSAQLMAGEREAYDALPDAIEYRPVYVGK